MEDTGRKLFYAFITMIILVFCAGSALDAWKARNDPALQMAADLARTLEQQKNNPPQPLGAEAGASEKLLVLTEENIRLTEENEQLKKRIAELLKAVPSPDSKGDPVEAEKPADLIKEFEKLQL